MNVGLPFSILGGAPVRLFHTSAALRVWLYRQGWIPQRKLRGKVISVGNIAWGGTGKTPFVIWLAGRLTAAGRRVAILTRGYRRTSTEPVRVLPPGTPPEDAARDGDEAQLYLRHLQNVPVGIASSRDHAGRRIEDQFPVDVHLLDDGFQHLALKRDLDIVLLDAANPWGARAGVSRLLRESPQALGRADAILLTHCEALPAESASTRIESLQATLRTLNPRAPQFLASTRLEHFVSPSGGHHSLDELRLLRCVGFCGIGSPDHFFSLLGRGGIHLAAQKRFPDHHRYSLEDMHLIERLARDNRAACVLTTEKDIVNMPPSSTLSVPLYWAEIAMKIEREEALLCWLAERLGLHMVDTGRASTDASTEKASAVS